MKPAEEAARALRSWLETEAGFGYVQQLANRYARDSRQDGSLATYLGNRFSRESVELREEIAQEFLEFLLQSFLPQLSNRPDQTDMILNDQVSKVLSFALKQFSWRLKDLARQKEVNPRAYLHRRIREVLDKDNNYIVYKDSHNILAYSPAICTDELHEDPAIFSSLDYACWPVPPALHKGRDSLFTAKYLSTAALVFWQETARQPAGNYIVPVRELVRYLAVHYPWINRTQPDSLSDALDLHGDMQMAEEQYDRIAALGSISILAAQFAMGMDEQSCRIFLWTLDDPPVPFEEIARRLDLPDHNRPYRINKKTIFAMKKFTATWPGPPLEELPEDVGLAFIEAVKKICEKSVC